jgi:hypothetical protein
MAEVSAGSMAASAVLTQRATTAGETPS